MTDKSIPDLLAERKALALRRDDINQRLDAVDRLLFAKLEAALGAFGFNQPATKQVELSLPALPALPASSQNAVAHVEPPATPASAHYAEAPYRVTRVSDVGSAIANGTRKLLLKSAKPLKIRDIYEGLKEAGVDIPGKVPLNNLSAHLSRSNEFELVSGNRWWFAEKQTAL